MPRMMLVDVEASGKTPASAVMTEFAVVDYATRSWFHGHLWDFEPNPDIPALPVPTRENYGFTAITPDGEDSRFTGVRVDIAATSTQGAAEVFAALNSWMRHLGGDERPVFVSDNPGFDFMWVTFGYDQAGVENPFGHSSRRIGDFAAGLAGDWKRSSAWKRHRRTRHDHNPVNDALGNAEALAVLLASTQASQPERA